MRNPITFVLSSAVILSALSLPALTSPALADKGPGLFERSDKDGDGFVTKLEFSDNRAAMFQEVDANKDGILSQDELQKAREAWHQKMGKPATDQSQDQSQAQPGKEKRGFMKRIDANEDGQISAEEFAAAGEKMFAKLDDNADGKIAQDEVPQHRKHQQDEQPAQ